MKKNSRHQILLLPPRCNVNPHSGLNIERMHALYYVLASACETWFLFIFLYMDESLMHVSLPLFELKVLMRPTVPISDHDIRI